MCVYIYIYIDLKYIYIYVEPKILQCASQNINRNTTEGINKNNSFISRLVSSVHADSSGLNDKFTVITELYTHFVKLLI